MNGLIAFKAIARISAKAYKQRKQYCVWFIEEQLKVATLLLDLNHQMLLQLDVQPKV